MKLGDIYSSDLEGGMSQRRTHTTKKMGKGGWDCCRKETKVRDSGAMQIGDRTLG